MGAHALRYVSLVLSVFAARFLATAIAFPAADGDLGWQRWLGERIAQTGRIPQALGGETFTAAGQPWVAQEWGFSLIAAHARGGLAWVVFAGGCGFAAVAALAVAAWAGRRRGASARALPLAVAFAGIALYESTGVRAQVVAWPLAALFLALLECEPPALWAAPFVAALWSNVHASAMLAPVFAAAAALGTFADERAWTPPVQRAVLVALGSAVAILANPFGFGLPVYALALFHSNLTHYISEWQPSRLADTSFALGALPLLALALAFAGSSSPRRFRDLCLLAPATFLALGAARNIALFGIVAVPPVAAALSRRVAWFSPAFDPAPLSRPAALVLPAFSLASAAFVAVGLLRSPDRRGDDLARGAIARLASLPGQHRLLCADFAWCGLALERRRIAVFLDGRADPYPESVWRDYGTVVRLQPRWRRVLDARRVDAVIAVVGTPLDQALAQVGGWRRTSGEGRYRLWLRPVLRLDAHLANRRVFHPAAL